MCLFHAFLGGLNQRSGRHGRSGALRRRLRRRQAGGCTLAGGSHLLPELLQGDLGDLFECLEDPLTVDGRGLEPGEDVIGVEVGVELVDRQDVLEITLVVLKDQGNLFDVEAELGQILAEVLEALDVRLAHWPLGIGHEDDSVYTRQRNLPSIVNIEIDTPVRTPRSILVACGSQWSAESEAPHASEAVRKAILSAADAAVDSAIAACFQKGR